MKKELPYIFIPTEKESTVFLDENGKAFYSINIDQEQNHFKPQFIYILSDEEIKEDGEYGVVQREDGEWILGKVSMLGHIKMFEMESSRTPLKDVKTKKIIATTNPELNKILLAKYINPDEDDFGALTSDEYKNGIPSISQSDIEYIIDLHNSKSKSVDVVKKLESLVAELPVDWMGTGTSDDDYGWGERWDKFIKELNQALQDNADKKFTLEDLKEAFRQGTNCEIKNKDYDKAMFEMIQSLTKEKSKSDTVTVEYEEIIDKPYMRTGMELSKTVSTQPKLKDGHIVIVK